MRIFSLAIIFSTLLLTGCDLSTPSGEKNYAPVVDLQAEQAKQTGYYTIKPGETIYFVAWRFDLDYAALAKVNHLKSPYTLKPGMRLYLKGAENMGEPSVETVTPIKKPKPAVKPAVKPRPLKLASVSTWRWPAKGILLEKFSARNKGINIGGSLDAPIRATAAGKVVYSGNGLPGYGELLIIKHNKVFLSAYAHNASLLVHVGQHVRAGQMIARMGSTGAQRVMLHFEMRKYGKPVNPLKYLP